jgi:type IV pilus assembly protein PilV
MNMHRERLQRGLTLVENLVALLLLSFALLGLAGLIVKTLGREKDSVSHSLAALQAQDIADRMRANRKGYDNGDYLTALSVVDAGTSQSCSASGFGKATGTVAVCTPTQMAQDDAYNWRQWISLSLPGAIGVVCNDDTPDDGTYDSTSPNATQFACDGGTRVVIKIFWNVSRNGGRASSSDPLHPDNVQRFVMVYRP